MICVGKVCSIDPEHCTVRVIFEDRNLVSYDLPVLVRQTKINKDFYMPDIGEHVVCVFLDNGSEQGFVLGAFYSKEDRVSSVVNSEKRRIDFGDGSWLEFDRSTGAYIVHITGDFVIESEKHGVIKASRLDLNP
jgi:phage baseplate assembly protein V